MTLTHDYRPLSPRPVVPEISAVICTYNRCEVLLGALQSLIDQELQPQRYEVIVVDNASTDRTKDVVRACQSQQPQCNIRLVYEQRAGLSYARNTGYHAALGQYVAYLDDDALASPEWLKAGLESFQSETQPVAVVGPVYPMYPQEKPAWFNDKFETFDCGDEPILLTGNQSFMGGNAMYRRSALEQVGGFDPRFGIVAEQLWLGEELDLLRRMRRVCGEDCCIYYDPRVAIRHKIGPEKLAVAYILKRRYRNGQCLALMESIQGVGGKLLYLSHRLAWVGWLTVSALANCWRYRSMRAWISERGAPLAVQFGRISATWATWATWATRSTIDRKGGESTRVHHEAESGNLRKNRDRRLVG